MKVYGITGWKNSGKTTLIERLIAAYGARGLSVSTIKHTHHSFDTDRPGKDSFRHRAAGARQVLLASQTRWALLTENRAAPEPDLAALLARLDPVDLVLVEGFKRDPHRKLEVRRAATGQDLVARDDVSIEAVASDGPVEDVRVPVFDLDDVAGIAAFILGRAGLSG
jgi:molybdopterin-guanine dinucleotide biosynthesis adapter protein